MGVEWLLALAVNLAVGLVAFLFGWVGGHGFLAGAIAGTVIFAGSTWKGWLLLVIFFVVGSLVTRHRYREKQKLGAAQEHRGARGAKEAAANTGVALVVSILAIFYDWPCLPVALAAAFATALADTTASELGPIWGRRTVHPLTFRRVPPGTEGAVSLEGTLAGAMAALLLAMAGVLTGYLETSGLWIVPVAALLASYLESVLGSWKKFGFLRQNELLNFINTAVGATLGSVLAIATGGTP